MQYKPNYDTYNEIIFRTIIAGGSLKSEVDHLRHVARKYMRRARIAEEADQAIKLHKVLDELPRSQKDIESVFTVYNEILSKHDLVHDDLFIIAAYENYAKAILLGKQYVIHQLSKPKKLRNQQYRRPVHFKTLRGKCYKDSFFIEHKTIGVSVLLNSDYAKKIGITSNEVKSLEKCRLMRNQIHFGGVRVHSFDKNFFEGISSLRGKICD